MGAKDVRTRHQHFFAQAKNDLGIELQVGIEQVEVFDDHPAAMPHSLGHHLGNLPELVESLLITHIDMVGMRAKAVGFAEIEDRPGAQVDAFVVVGEFETGEQAANQCRLARAFRPDNADQQIRRIQVSLGNVLPQPVQAQTSARGVINGVDQGGQRSHEDSLQRKGQPPSLRREKVGGRMASGRVMVNIRRTSPAP